MMSIILIGNIININDCFTGWIIQLDIFIVFFVFRTTKPIVPASTFKIVAGGIYRQRRLTP